MISFISCQKKNDFETLETDGIAEIKADIEVLYYSDSKSNYTNILYFKDANTVVRKLEELKLAKEQHDIDFVEKYNYLDIEALNIKDKEKFDEYAPLKEFNENYGFKSLIDEYINKEREWLKKGELNDENDPELYFNDLDAIKLSIFNKEYAIKVDKTIIKYVKGGIIEIMDGSFKTLTELEPFTDINNIDKTHFKNINIYSDLSEVKSDCDNYQNNSQSWNYYSNNHYYYKMRYYSKYRRYLWGNQHWHIELKSKTKSYRKRRLCCHGYVKYRTSTIKASLMEVGPAGDGGYDITNTANPDGPECGDWTHKFSNYIKTRWNAKDVTYERSYHYGLDQHSHIEVEHNAIKSYHEIIGWGGSHVKWRYMY